MKKKELKQEQLENVSGSATGSDGMTQCPKCGLRFSIHSNATTTGSGCDTQTYLTCPYCGHSYQW